MKKYFKLLDLLINVSNCVAFEVEAYENLNFKITEEEIIDLFNKYIKNFSINFKNEEKEYKEGKIIGENYSKWKEFEESFFEFYELWTNVDETKYI